MSTISLSRPLHRQQSPQSKSAIMAAAMFGLITIAGNINAAEAVFKSDVEQNTLSAHWKKIDAEEIIKNIEANSESYPVDFRDLATIVKGSQAEKLGLTVNCKVSKVPNDPDSGGKLHWVDKAGNHHASALEPGVIGISWDDGFDATAWYVFKGKRDKKWDSMVVAALQSQWRDVKLADAFWHKAMDLGYTPDHLSNISGLIIALNRQDAPRAEAFAEAFGSISEAPIEFVNYHDWYQLAACTGNPKWILNAADSYERLKKNPMYSDPKYAIRARQLAKAQTHFAKESQKKDLKPPSELAKQMKRTSYIGDATTDSNWVFNKDAGGESDWLARVFSGVNEAKKSGKKFVPLGQGAMPDSRFNAWIGPKTPAQDMDVRINFESAALTDRRDRSQNMRATTIALCCRNGKQLDDAIPTDGQIIGLQFSHGILYESTTHGLDVMLPSMCSINRFLIGNNPTTAAKHMPSPLRPLVPVEENQNMEIRLVRVGNQAEAFLNGKRVAIVHVPIERTDIGVGLFVCGTQITINSVEADILD